MRHLPVCAAIALTASSPTFAHHSDAGLDMENVVIFEGTIKEFFWRNPHVYFTVETTDGSGELVEWALHEPASMSLWPTLSRERLLENQFVNIKAFRSNLPTWQPVSRLPVC